MRKQVVLFAAAISIMSSQAIAQMAKPSFSPELAKLSFIVGHFTTQTRIMMGDNLSNGTGTIKAHWGLDSMFVLYSSEESNAALGSYKGFGVLGYDSENGQYVLHMFNNFGDRPEYKGNFVGDTLTMSAKIETPQGPFDQRMKWFKEGNDVRLLIFTDFGQGYSLIVDQTAMPSADSTK
jgi:hypothetical protein